MTQRFEDFVTGITVCYKYLQRIKSMAVNEMGLKGSHVMCMFYLRQHEDGLTASRLCELCADGCDTDTLLQQVFDTYQLRMTFEQYALVGSTVRSYLTWLMECGRVQAICQNNRLLWKKV